MNWLAQLAIVIVLLLFFWAVHKIVCWILHPYLKRIVIMMENKNRQIGYLTNPSPQGGFTEEFQGEAGKTRRDATIKNLQDEISNLYRKAVLHMVVVFLPPLGTSLHKNDIIAAYNKNSFGLEWDTDPLVLWHILQGKAPKGFTPDSVQIGKVIDLIKFALKV